MKHSICITLLSGMIISTPGCSSGDGGDSEVGSGSGYDFSAILENTVDTTIITTYHDLFQSSKALLEKVEALADHTTSENLDAAREAWVDTRIPWEQSEAFLYGPVADMGLDPALDSWPVDHVQLDQVLASGLDLTADSITENLGGGLKGFHTIEYLLWDDHDKSAADLEAAPREMEYLVAVSESLMNDAETLYMSWATGSEDKGFGNFGESFYLAGKEGGRYFSQVDAMQQLVNGMVDICDEVANGKIADPFDEKDVALVESQFSYNSIQDFADNLRSVQNVYTGTYNGDGSPGLTDYVSETNADLDARVKDEIQTAIDAIYAIVDGDEPFRDAVVDPAKASGIEAAQDAIRTVMDTMAGPVMAAIVN
jgi:putative iron-regulated protein